MITITKDINEATCITHAGNFHADDVFSTIFLEKLYGNITLIRLKEYQDNNTKLAFDIGLGKFDHHGTNLKARPDGIHYCSFGLLWHEYGLEYLKKEKITNPEYVFNIFDYLLVESIDAFDNGEYELTTNFNIYTISSLIETFRPNNNENEDECFLKSCNFAKTIFDIILKESINKSNNILKIQNLIPTIDNKILILKEYIPYEYAIFYLNLDINFVIYPSNRGGYAAHTISTQYKGFTSKIPFPKEWAGLRDKELQRVTKVKTARFCHNKCFLVTADTLEDTILLVNKTINKKDACCI